MQFSTKLYTPPARNWSEAPPSWNEPFELSVDEWIRQYFFGLATEKRKEIDNRLDEGTDIDSVSWLLEQLENYEAAFFWSQEPLDVMLQVSATTSKTNDLKRLNKANFTLFSNRAYLAGARLAYKSFQAHSEFVHRWFTQDWLVLGPRSLVSYPHIQRAVSNLSMTFAVDCPRNCEIDLPLFQADYAARVIVAPDHPRGIFAEVRSSSLEACENNHRNPVIVAHETARKRLKELI